MARSELATHLLLEAAHGLPLRVQGGLQGLDELLHLAVLLLFALQDRLHLQHMAEVVSQEGCQVLNTCKAREKAQATLFRAMWGPCRVGAHTS